MVSLKNLFSFALFNSYILKCLAAQNGTPTTTATTAAVSMPSGVNTTTVSSPSGVNTTTTSSLTTTTPTPSKLPSGVKIQLPKTKPQQKSPSETFFDEAKACTGNFKATAISPSTKPQFQTSDRIKFHEVFAHVGAENLNTLGIMKHLFDSTSMPDNEKLVYSHMFLEIKRPMEFCTATSNEISFYNAFLQGGQLSQLPFANAFVLESMVFDNLLAVFLYNVKKILSNFQMLKTLVERRSLFFDKVVGATDMSGHTGQEFGDTAFYHDSAHLLSYFNKYIRMFEECSGELDNFRRNDQPAAREAFFNSSGDAIKRLGDLVPVYSPYSTEVYESNVKQVESQQKTTEPAGYDDEFNENFEVFGLGSFNTRQSSPTPGFGLGSGSGLQSRRDEGDQDLF